MADSARSRDTDCGPVSADSDAAPDSADTHAIRPRVDWPARPRVAIIGSRRKVGIEEAVSALADEIESRGDAQLAAVDVEDALDLERLDADLLVVFGGDGSLVSVARRMGANQIPVVGVNFGKFGFLAEYEHAEFQQDLERLLRGEFRVRPRLLIGGRLVRGDQTIFSGVAMNEFVISRSHYSRIVQLELYVNDKYCTRYHVDGLILSTPSGSTAHSLSAGGPVLTPGLDAWVITPICPHTMTVRPLVVPADSRIRVEVLHHDDTVALTVDGQDCIELAERDVLHVSRPETCFRLIRSGRRSFFKTLRTKLNWAGHAFYTDMDRVEGRPTGPVDNGPAD